MKRASGVESRHVSEEVVFAESFATDVFDESPGADGLPDLLEVEDLTVEIQTDSGPRLVVEDINFTIGNGKTLGLVGESGSGKTATALAIAGLIRPPTGSITKGRVLLEGRDLVAMSERQLASVRGLDLAMIFQEPRRSLDPSFTVGAQIAEVVRRHRGWSRKRSWRHAVEMLDRVRIPSPERRAHAYPHMLSGGMCQRVMIALALSCEPRLLIADEPTTALDVTIQREILKLIRELQIEMGLTVLFITHDLGIVAEMCDEVAIMYGGQVVERAPAMDLFLRPAHPYTEALLKSIPLPQSGSTRQELLTIKGVPPGLDDRPQGCRFHPRCAYVQSPLCVAEVPEMHTQALNDCRCVRAQDLALRGIV